MSLVNDMGNYKNKFDLGKFEGKSYLELLKLLNPENFYDSIFSMHDFQTYLQALDVAYCKGKKYKPSKVVFEELPYSAMGNVNHRNHLVIAFSNVYEKLLPIMQQYKNTYFPCVVFDTLIHEITHTAQMDAVKNNRYAPLNSENTIAALDAKLNILKFNALSEGRISADDSKNEELGFIFFMDQVKKSFMGSLFEHYNYGNNPSEIAARDSAIEELSRVVNSGALENKNEILFKEYLKEFKQKSLNFATDERCNNYNFFEELSNTALFDADENIKYIRKTLCNLVDEIFISKNLTTFAELEEYKFIEELHEQLEFLASKVGTEITEKEFNIRADKLERKAMEKQEAVFDSVDGQYLELFPTTAKLRTEDLTPNPDLLADKNVFDEALKFMFNVKVKE